MSFVEGIKSDLNRMRKDPSSFIKLFKIMKNTLERFNKNAKLVKDVEQFIIYLGIAPILPELNVSFALIKAAEKRLDHIEVLGKYEPVQESALSEFVSRSGEGFSVIYEVVDDGSQNPEEVLSRLIMNENDTERINRKVLFEPKNLFFGVGHRLINERHLTVILLCENIIDFPEKSMRGELTDRINMIRTKPSSYVNEFEIALNIYKRVKKSTYLADDCQTLIQQLKNEKPKSEVKESELLNNVAKAFVEAINKNNNSNIIDVNDLIIEAKKSVSGFKFIVGVGAYNIFDPDNILHKILINEFDTQRISRQAIFNESTQYIGIHHEMMGYSPITILVLADGAQSPDLMTLEEKLTNEFNRIRTKPTELKDSLEKYRENLQKSGKNKGQLDYVNELLNQIKNSKPIPELIYCKPLCEAAEEFLKIYGKQSSVFDSRVYREEKEFLATRLGHYCTGYSEVYQFVESGSDNLKDIIFNLLIDPRDERHEFRSALLSERIKYFGIARSEFKNKTLTSIIVADYVELIQEKVFIDSLFEEINHLRHNPKSYLKYFQDFEESIPITKGALKANAYKMVTFLKSSRFYGPLQISDLLTKAAESRVAFFKEEGNRVKKNSLEDIKVFLSDYCSEFLNVAEIATKGLENAKDLLVNCMAAEDFQTGARSYIFSQKLYYVGLAYDPETKIQVIFFADYVEEKKDDLIYAPQVWKKVNRPELTQDESLQIRKDFHRLDSSNKGYIMPQHIYTFMCKAPGFSKKNPIYFNAIKNNIDNIHYEQAGLNVEDFIEECKKVIFSLNADNWKNIYRQMLHDPTKKTLDYESFRKITKSLGYKMSDEEAKEIILKLGENTGIINIAMFQQIMEIETGNRI